MRMDIADHGTFPVLARAGQRRRASVAVCAGMATLELHGLRKSFGLIDVLHGIDLTLADGEMLVIVGASGCGKSTLLRLVAGLGAPDRGPDRARTGAT